MDFYTYCAHRIDCVVAHHASESTAIGVVAERIIQRLELVVLLTTKSENIDQILGLELGADDDICKPVEPRLLLARINALLPHSARHQQTANTNRALCFDHLSIHPAQRSVSVHGQAVTLSTPEYELLWLLTQNTGQVLSRAEIFAHLRGFE